MKTKLHVLIGAGLLIGTTLLSSSCGQKKKILVDGSSTVYPITEAVAEEYRKVEKNIHVTVGISGTGGGFKKFCKGETDISDASRPIKGEELKLCKEGGVEYIELPVAYDGMAVVVNPANDFVKELTVADLKKIFDSEKPAASWKDVNPSYPDLKIKVYAPGKDSGTYDYFVEEILGKGKSVRPDAAFSEDDNTLVTGVAGDKGGIGFFGVAYYTENKGKIKDVPIVNPKTKKSVVPSMENILSGNYAPLSRPLFIYVSTKALAKPEIQPFVEFYLKHAGNLSDKVGYVPLAPGEYMMTNARFASRKQGTMYEGHMTGKTLEELLKANQ